MKYTIQEKINRIDNKIKATEKDIFLLETKIKEKELSQEDIKANHIALAACERNYFKLLERKDKLDKKNQL